MMVTLAAATLLVTPGQIKVDDHAIRLRDLVPSARGENVVIARIPAKKSSLTLSGAAVSGLLARVVPSLTAVSPSGEYTFVVRPQSGGAQSCWVARKYLPAGSPIASDEAVAAPCGRQILLPDAVKTTDGQLVARRAIPSGAALGRLYFSSRAAVPAGTVLTLVSQSGPVTIERRVTLLQAGETGHRVFVRDGANAVFSAILQVERPR